MTSPPCYLQFHNEDASLLIETDEDKTIIHQITPFDKDPRRIYNREGLRDKLENINNLIADLEQALAEP